MRKINFKLNVVLLLSVLNLISCYREKDIENVFDKLSPLTKEVLNKSTLQEMRQGMAMLSVEERAMLWETKLNFIISNPKEKFTKDQRKIITKIKTFLEVNGMKKLMENSDLGNEFLKINYKYFSQHFSKEQLNILLESPYFKTSLLISKIDINMMKRLISPKIRNTEEIINSTTAETTETGSCTCLYDMGCPGAYNYCQNVGCVVDNNYEMCGIFGTSSCKKRCSGSEPNLNPDPNGGSPL